jgi:phage-related protein
MAQYKVVDWVGSSLDDLKELPKRARRDIGYVLDYVQRGEYHQRIKPLRGLPGVYEIRADDSGNTYRAVYVVNLGAKIYVLHVFKKRSKQGSEIPKEDLQTIQSRLKKAKEDSNG